jgi:uncharacterized repeat protein (TIGR01451 family)
MRRRPWRQTALGGALVSSLLGIAHAGTLGPSPAPPHRTSLPLARPNLVTPVLTQSAKLGGLADAQGDLNDQFGSAVAIDGDTAVVGVPGKDTSGAEAGAALVFFRVGGAWTLQATLVPTSPADGLGFGSSVAISGNTVVVGASGNYITTGKAFVFLRSGQTWSAQAVLTGLDSVAFDSFGSEVAVSGDTAVVSAPVAATGFGFRSGAAYVFLRTGSSWSQQQKLLPADLAAEDRFGASVALDGDTVILGASDDDTGVGIDAGSAYVFTRAGGAWSQQQKLLSPTAAAYDYFGTAVALSADVAVVGAPGVDGGSSYDTGIAFVYERSGGAWSQTATLAPPSPGSGARYGTAVGVAAGVAVLGSGGYYSSAEGVYVFRAGGGTWGVEAALPNAGPAPLYFGTAVGVWGGSVLVGAPGADQTGAAFVYTFTSGAWAEEARLDDTGTTRGDAFGTAVAVDGDTMAVGSPTDDTLSARGSGSVTVFARTGGVWSFQQKLLPEPGDTRRFGRSLDLEGDLLVVGAATQSYYGGAAYVFRKGGSWGLEQKLDSASDGDFGAGVTISGGTVLVGEPNAQIDGVYGAGAASAYIRLGGAWVVQQRLRAPTALAYGSFGRSLALAGDVGVIGAPGFSSRAYVMRRSGGVWSFSQELLPTQTGESFGSAIALHGSDLVVGSPGSNFPFASGSVYAFLENGGAFGLAQRLACPSTTAYLRCGAAVALSSDTLLAGAPIDQYSSVMGSAAVYSRNGGQWTLRQQILPSDATPPLSFGAGVALAGTEVVVGAPYADGAAHESGAVYVFGPSSSDLSLAMTAGPLVVTQGELVTVGLDLTNGGPATVSGVAVSVSLQPGLVFDTSNTGECQGTPGGASCTFSALAPVATRSVEFFAVAAGIGTFTTTATVAAGGPTAQATTTILAASADVALTMATPAGATRNATVEYRITVRNNGPGTAAAVQVAHPTPPGLVLENVNVLACPSFPCVIPRISTNGTYTFLATYRVPKDYSGPNPIVNIATVMAANADPFPGNNTANGSTPLLVDDTYLRFYTVSPCRLVDTRDAALGGPLPLAPGAAAVYTAGARSCGVPYSARALAVNVTATEPTAGGYVKLYAHDATTSVSSFVNYQAGQTRANNGFVGLDASSSFVVEVGQANGTVHVIVDVVGYFQ